MDEKTGMLFTLQHLYSTFMDFSRIPKCYPYSSWLIMKENNHMITLYAYITKVVTGDKRRKKICTCKQYKQAATHFM